MPHPARHKTVHASARRRIKLHERLPSHGLPQDEKCASNGSDVRTILGICAPRKTKGTRLLWKSMSPRLGESLLAVRVFRFARRFRVNPVLNRRRRTHMLRKKLFLLLMLVTLL